jgi:putative DNA primase/helicase
MLMMSLGAEGARVSISTTKPDLFLIERNTPAALRDRPQWVAWRTIVRSGKPTKVPVNPRTGDLAKSNDKSTWGTFEQALNVCRTKSDLSGIGFVFSPDDPYCGVDLDDCIDLSTDSIKLWAKHFIEQLESYSEISPSGTGVKVFLKANKPGSRCRKRYFDGEVEIYDNDRFFVVTGRRLDSVPPETELRQEQLEAVYREVFGDDDDLELLPAIPAAGDAVPFTEHAQLCDDEIIELASNQRRSGAKFSALWAGDWNAYFNSASEADSSVVFSLAFYTKDRVQIDRMFRRSGLMRPKWDEQHGHSTYGEMTITKALGRVSQQYHRNQQGVNNRAGKTLARGQLIYGEVDQASGRVVLSTSRTLPTAEAFVRQHYFHQGVRTLLHYAGVSLRWRNNRYVEIEDNALRHQLLPWLDSALRLEFDKSSKSWVPNDFSANPQTVNAALDSIRAFTHLPASTSAPSWLDGDEGRPDPCEILPCSTSLLHLPTMQSLQPTPAFFTLNAINIDPDPQAAIPTNWFRFLETLFEQDCQAWDLLQEWFGYCLTADTSFQKMLLIVGPRRSGKGTLARILTRLIGASNVGGPTTTSLAGPFGLQHLIGKSLAIVSDARFSGDIQPVVERLLCISGEDMLTVDRKHLPSVTLKLPTRFMFLSNELPRLSDSSGALAGRFLLLRLTKSFYGCEDRQLTQKLVTELPGILNWSIQGWQNLYQRGHFIQPANAKEALEDMEDLASPVGAFVKDKCKVGPDERVPTADLYYAWRAWCVAEGRSTISTKQTFGRDLLAALPGVICRRNHKDGRFYEGLSLPGIECPLD